MQNETGRREKPSELYSIRSLNGNWSSYSKGKKRSSAAAATPAEAEAATATTAGCSSKNNTNNFRMSLEATKTTVTTELSEKKRKTRLGPASVNIATALVIFVKTCNRNSRNFVEQSIGGSNGTF